MEKINIAELLKDCPKGMELDWTMCDKVVLVGVDNSLMFPIKIRCKDGCLFVLTKYGQCCDSDYAKCVIFPKGKTTWEGFVPPCKFKDGDIVYTNGDSIAILSNRIESHPGAFRSCCGLYNYEFDTDVVVLPERFATEEEKAKLFQAIKANGYKWNEETKTLEKLIQPKFKIGDKIIHKHNKSLGTIALIDESFYHCAFSVIPICDQDEWELVLDKFDITTLKPFDKVLARDTSRQIWIADLFSHDVKEPFGGYRFACIGHHWHQCIPYEGNEHLLGTTNDCNGYFKTWE